MSSSDNPLTYEPCPLIRGFRSAHRSNPVIETGAGVPEAGAWTGIRIDDLSSDQFNAAWGSRVLYSPLYEDHFNDQSTVTYMSKSQRTLKSPKVVLMRNQKSNGIRLPLFVKKSNAESTEHYFIGNLAPVDDSFSEEMMPVTRGPDVSVVKMVFSLDRVVEDNLYKYLTSAN